MSSTQRRRRIPTCIGASCLAAALAFSTGATIATAASQAPVAESMPAQDDPGSDQSGTDTSGSDTSSQQDGSHPQGTDTSSQQDGSHPQGTDTGSQHPQGTSKTDPQRDGMGQTDGNSEIDGQQQGTATTGKSEAQRECERANRPWAEAESGGFCGEFYKIEGNQDELTDAEKKEVKKAEVTVGCLKDAALAIAPHPRVLGKRGTVIQWVSNGLDGYAIIENAGTKEKVDWKAVLIDLVPGVDCYKLVVLATAPAE
ncbi:hypothetical protein [Streptomyces sp. 147326]|uniref:hypothetical protein n=1 Tax=Streptomyces sp. 147326 TaxID=3074379 RepID=UPI0038576ACA